MSNIKKLMMTAAGGEALNVEDVFSTYLYDGTNTTNTITNNIDLAGEGGIVWIKNRVITESNLIYRNDSGTPRYLSSNSTSAENTPSDVISGYGLTQFNSDGFTLGGNYAGENGTASGSRYASWTFRKAPKFFDVVTYNGNSSTNVISHNLGSTPGCIIIKCTSSSAPSGTTSQWMVYHRGLSSPTAQALYLNGTAQAQGYGTGLFGVSDTTFTLNNTNETNDTGNSYVAYLFAHNDGDGEFGPNGDQDIIKCGSFTHSSSTGNDIDLGFEPQWLLYKASDSTIGWYIWDTMRGWNVVNQSYLRADTSSAESTGSNTEAGWPQITSTGFRLGTNSYAGDNKTFIYIAIRRGPMAIPTNATDVFDVAMSLNPAEPTFVSGFPVDMSIHKDTTGGATINGARIIQNKKLSINSNAAESSGNDEMIYSFMDGFYEPLDYGSPPGGIGSTNFVSYMWKAAPNYFDVVAYTGDGATNHTVSHNLGVAPEMIWIKNRGDSTNWPVYHSGLTSAKMIRLNSTSAEFNMGTIWGNQTFDASGFTVGSTSDETNKVNNNYIAYLFASLNGVSKVGSFSHTSGTTQNIDCGFSSGARFVLVKQYASTGSWFVYDTERGIVSGNDPRLKLDSTAAENTGNDDIDPYSAGFTLTTNFSGGSYIFYAVA